MLESLYTLALKETLIHFQEVKLNLSFKSAIGKEVRRILEADCKSKLRYRNQYTHNQLLFIKATPAELMVSLIDDKENEIYDMEYDDDDIYY